MDFFFLFGRERHYFLVGRGIIPHNTFNPKAVITCCFVTPTLSKNKQLEYKFHKARNLFCLLPSPPVPTTEVVFNKYLIKKMNVITHSINPDTFFYLLLRGIYSNNISVYAFSYLSISPCPKLMSTCMGFWVRQNWVYLLHILIISLHEIEKKKRKTTPSTI